MSLRTLPPELHEHILLLLAHSSTPTSIASLAQTCRKFRQMIYEPLDRHLWRGAFLGVFDDHRECDNAPDNFDWGEEFRRRVWASRFFRYHADSENTEKESDEVMTRALTALLSVFDTALPCRPHPDALSIGPELDKWTPDGDIHAFRAELVKQASNAPIAPAAHEPSPGSKNIDFLLQTFAHGLPLWLVEKLSLSGMGSKSWSHTTEALGLFHLTAYLSFSILHHGSTQPKTFVYLGRPKPMPKKEWGKMSTKERAMRIRGEARREVYEVAYLTRSRHWGPFLPVGESLEGAEEDSEQEQEAERESEADPDFEPLAEDGSLTSDTTYMDENTNNHGDETSSEEDTESNTEVSPAPSPPNPPQPIAPLPSPPPSQDLFPDWKHLAAIRLNVQACMEHAEPEEWEELKGMLLDLSALRGGRWIGPHPENHMAKGQSSDGKLMTIEGWDWAGVEGLWRRCVCWLDYHDLITMSTFYHDRPELLAEETLVLSIALKIVSYSPSHDPLRPNIHIEGMTGGNSWAEHGDPRRIWGTVSPCGGGGVRWSTFSSISGAPEEEEWVSEGVQLGGVGSSAGVLGLWTGARHEIDDPIGAWWQWRVA